MSRVESSGPEPSLVHPFEHQEDSFELVSDEIDRKLENYFVVSASVVPKKLVQFF